MKEKTQKVVAALMISADGKILLAKCKPLPSVAYGKAWIIPGGVVDGGETNEEALQREVFEETGIDISINTRLELVVEGDKDNVVRVNKNGEQILCHIEFYTYKITLPRNSKEYSLADTEELINLTWFEPHELQNLEHAKPSRNLFKKVGMPGF